MNDLQLYLVTYWQPISGLVIGILSIVFFLYIHLYRKQNVIHWIAKYIFRNQFMAEKSAEGAFNVASSFVFTVGGLWVILAMLYLMNV